MNHFSIKDRAQFGRMRVCILSPIIHVEPKWVQSMVNMVAYSYEQGLKVDQMGLTERMVVHWARNELAKAALDKGVHTHFLWLDSDHVFNPDLACQLARHFALPEVDAVSALYFSRTEPYMPVAYVKDETEDIYKHYPLLEAPNNLCEVDAVGFGAIMTKREIFEQMEYPWFGFRDAGEDIAFCVKAKQKGFRLFLDGQYKLGHFGDKQIITAQTYEAFRLANPERFGEKIKIALGGNRNVGTK